MFFPPLVESTVQYPRRNTLVILGLLVASLVTMCRSSEAQKTTSEYRYLRYARKYVHFAIHCGRITVVPLRTNSYSPRANEAGGRKEQVKIEYNRNNGTMRIKYDRSSKEEKLSVSAESNGRVIINREPGEEGKFVPSEFVQDPSGLTKLTYGKGDDKKTITVPTLWHLLLAHPDACKQYVLPYLQILKPDWQLAEQAKLVEKELLHEAKVGKLPDRKRWAEWVKQLGDENFARRQAADRELRALGQQVVPYLRSQKRDQLDAEQKFRIHRIIESLTNTWADESPNQVADTMLIDPTIWLILLDNDSQTTRELAAKHLAKLLEKPIDFDPSADAAKRKRQIEKLRLKVEGKH